MTRHSPFPRCSPEAVGIPSAAIHQLLDTLENGGFTRMHGLMIMRQGKVCAEGWWAPYAPGLHHSDHSLSKTYTATAIGLAEYEGLLRLDSRAADLLPDKMPPVLTDRLAALTVRDILLMGAGSETEAERYPADWLEDFFARPMEHDPGTFWRYNSHATAVLSAIVEKVSGQSMVDFLTPRLFDKIGINASRVLCRRGGDGTCLGGHGMFTTTEDNLRLMKLYLDGGVWEGERLLAAQFVRDATRPLMDTIPAHAHTPWIADNCAGYGYQIWQCRYPGAYRADGAYGQFSVVIPSLDMIVSIHECGYLGEHMTHNELRMLKGKTGEYAPVHGPQATLNALFEILIPQVQDHPLPPCAQSDTLKNRMLRLSLPRPDGGQAANWQAREAAMRLRADGGKISFGILYGMSKHRTAYPGAEEITLRFGRDELEISWTEGGVTRRLTADAQGGRRTGRLVYTQDREVVTRIDAAAWLDSTGRLQLSLLWTETEMENRFSFRFDGGQAEIEKWIDSGLMGAQVREKAVYQIC